MSLQRLALLLSACLLTGCQTLDAARNWLHGERPVPAAPVSQLPQAAGASGTPSPQASQFPQAIANGAPPPRASQFPQAAANGSRLAQASQFPQPAANGAYLPQTPQFPQPAANGAPLPQTSPVVFSGHADQLAAYAHQLAAQPLKPKGDGQEPEALPIPAPAEPIAVVPADLQQRSEWMLPDLERLALANNPSVAEASARVRAARGRWVQVGLQPNIDFGFNEQQTGGHGLVEQDGVYIGQDLIRLRKLRLNRAVVEQEIQVATQQLNAQERRVLTDVRLGFYEVLVAQRRVDLSEQVLKINEDALETAQALFDAKEVGQPDVLRATIEMQSSRLLLRTSRNMYVAAWTRLTAVLGMPNLPPQRLVGDLNAATEEFTQAEALTRLLGESPELRAAIAEVERTRYALARAKVEPIPNLRTQFLIQHDNSIQASDGAIQAIMAIPIWNRNQGGIREAESQVVVAQRAAGRVALGLQRRLANVYQQYASARFKVYGYTAPGGILENVGKSLEFVRAAYRAGEMNYIDLLTAQRTFAQMNLAYIEALGEMWSATMEIKGLLLKDSLQTNVP